MVQRVFRVQDVERRVLERKAFGVGDAEAEAGLVAPRIGLLDVDPYDLSDTLADQSRDPPFPQPQSRTDSCPSNVNPSLSRQRSR